MVDRKREIKSHRAIALIKCSRLLKVINNPERAQLILPGVAGFVVA